MTKDFEVYFQKVSDISDMIKTVVFSNFFNRVISAVHFELFMSKSMTLSETIVKIRMGKQKPIKIPRRKRTKSSTMINQKKLPPRLIMMEFMKIFPDFSAALLQYKGSGVRLSLKSQ